MTEENKPNGLAVILCFSASCFFSGWILQSMWNWFIVPFGVMRISLAHAIGLDAMFTIYRYNKNSQKKDKAEFWMGVIGSVVVHLILLFVGFLAHFYV